MHFRDGDYEITTFFNQRLRRVEGIQTDSDVVAVICSRMPVKDTPDSWGDQYVELYTLTTGQRRFVKFPGIRPETDPDAENYFLKVLRSFAAVTS